MLNIKKQLYSILGISGLNAFQIAGASWVAILASRGFSLVEIGLAESCFHLASLLFEIPSGVLSDVFGRRKSMILSQCMFIVSALFMAFSQTLMDVCLALILDALGYNFASGSREALTYDSLKAVDMENRYIEFSAFDLSIYRLGNASAILCAGLALTIGHKTAYLIDAFLGIICLILSFQLREVQLDTNQFEGHIKDRMCTTCRESFLFILQNGSTFKLMLWNAFIGCSATLTVFFLQARLPLYGVTSSQLGPMLFFISLGGVVGARLVLKLSILSYPILSIICIGGVVFGTICGLGTFPLWMCIGGFLSNLCDDLLQLRTDAILNERFHSSQRATLNSIVSQIFSILMIILSPLAGWLFTM